MKTIKKIAPVLMTVIMAVSLTACGSNNSAKSPSSTVETAQAKTFPKFQGTDFDGNSVDDSLFCKNEMTLLNFWFNGCSACVNEMPELEELNKKLREKGAELIGVNVEAGESDDSLSEAKEILSKQGATYRNIFITEGQEAKDYLGEIFAFPTTIMVDKNGNIIGDPITGSIEDPKKIDAILKMVDDLKNGKEITTPLSSEETPDDKIAALGKEQNNIFLEHKEVWDRIFNNIQKSNVEQMSDCSYAELLKAQIEADKNSFTEEELKILREDVKKIAELDKKIEELTNTK